MFEKVQDFIQRNSLLGENDRVVVGVSGGPDSIALLHVLLRLSANYHLYLHAVHLNHKIRGKDADEDASFVRDLAQEWGLDCTVHELDVPGMSEAYGLSTEEAGRQARYALFAQVAAEHDCTKIMVAHHSDDQAETILLNLLRGAGLDGLAGMKAVRDGMIVRPFLQVSRQEIEAYCLDNQLPTRQDASNYETDYRRNKIRLELIPTIEKEYNPQFRKALNRTAAILADENHMLHCMAESILQAAMTLDEKSCTVPLEILLQQPVAMQRRLIRMMISKLQGSMVGIAFEHVEQIIGLLQNPKTGKRSLLPGKLEAYIQYQTFFVRHRNGEAESSQIERMLEIPGSLQLPELDCVLNAEYLQENLSERAYNRSVIYVDHQKIQLPLSVRTRKTGDRLELPGGLGSSKVKKIMIDRKVPQEQRSRIPLVVDARDRIIWIVGIRTSDLCVQGLPCERDIRIETRRYSQGG